MHLLCQGHSVRGWTMGSRDRLLHMSPASLKTASKCSGFFWISSFLGQERLQRACPPLSEYFFWRDAFRTSSSLITSKARRSPNTTLPCWTRKPSTRLADSELLAAISSSAFSTIPYWLRTARIADEPTVHLVGHKGLMDRAGPPLQLQQWL